MNTLLLHIQVLKIIPIFILISNIIFFALYGLKVIVSFNFLNLGQGSEVTVLRSRCIGDFEDVLATSQFCYKFLKNMNIDSAKLNCNSDRNYNSAMVLIQNQEELKYVGLRAHKGNYKSVDVWTGFRREKGM